MNAQLENLVSVLETQNEQKKDFITSGMNLSFAGGNLVVMRDRKEIEYSPTSIFHSQVAEKLNIPKAYYDRMRVKAADLLDSNVNHWLHKEQKNIMVRAFENDDNNIARAFLSNSYSILDNYEVLFEALEAIKLTGLEVEIVNAELSEQRMYLKVVCPEVEVQAKKMLENYGRAAGVNFGVMSGFVLQNSEIGMGAFQIAPRGVVKVCMNGMVMQKDALRKTHLGAKMDELGFNTNEAVKAANLKLIKEQVKHAVKVFLSKQYLTKLVDVYTELGDKTIEAPVANVIQVVANTYNISEERKGKLLQHFIKQGDNRRIGLVNAITEECQGLKDADLKHDSEVICMDILTGFNKIEAAAFKTKFTSN